MTIMIPDNMISLLRSVRTKQEKENLRDQISVLKAALFRSDPHEFEKILATRLPGTMASTMREILSQSALKDNPDAQRKFFQNVTEVIDKLPFLKLNIAFVPSEEMIQRLHEWVQKNMGAGVILDMAYDALILGGAQIIFQGKYKEVTLSQMITNVLIKEKTNVLKLIK